MLPPLRRARPHQPTSPRRARAARKILSWLLRETRAQDVVEYALLLMMLSLASVAVIPELACVIQCAFAEAADSIDDAAERKPPKKIPPGQKKKCCKEKK